MAKIAQPAGIISKNSNSAPSRAALNIVGNAGVLGVKCGREWRETGFVFQIGRAHV